MSALPEFTPGTLVDELVYRGYAHNRDAAPDITPERWAKIFENAEAMEARYQRERGAHREPLRVAVTQ